jgi:hypothetical protein
MLLSTLNVLYLYSSTFLRMCAVPNMTAIIIIIIIIIIILQKYSPCPHHEDVRSRGNHGTWWRWVVSLMPRPLYPLAKIPVN